MRKALPLQYDRLGKSTVLADDTKNGGAQQLERMSIRQVATLASHSIA